MHCVRLSAERCGLCQLPRHQVTADVVQLCIEASPLPSLDPASPIFPPPPNPGAGSAGVVHCIVPYFASDHGP